MFVGQTLYVAIYKPGEGLSTGSRFEWESYMLGSVFIISRAKACFGDKDILMHQNLMTILCYLNVLEITKA